MTHKKIAELAHVSVSTVSKALSGSAEVSKELAEEIRRIALEVGYFEEKNKRSRNYRKNSSINIAVLIPEIVSVTYSTVVSYIKETVEKRGGYVSVYIYDFDLDKLSSMAEMIIIKGYADGIITFSSFEISTKPNIPVLCLGETENSEFDTIHGDIKKDMLDITEYLFRLGHRKIGYAGELKTSVKAEALKLALERYSLDVNEDYFYVSEKRFGEAGTDAAQIMLERKERPTAVVCAYDEIAIAFMNEAAKNKINVPEDISVIGINNIPAASYSTPLLTTFTSFDGKKYMDVVNRFIDKIISGSKEIFHECPENEVIERESVKALK